MLGHIDEPTDRMKTYKHLVGSLQRGQHPTTHLQVGAQNVGLNPNGAYTGEVSAEILKVRA